MKITNVLSIAALSLLFTIDIAVCVAGECDTQEQLTNSRHLLMQDTSAMQSNIQGFKNKVIQAFDAAAKEKHWTPLYQATLYKHIMSSKQVAELDAAVAARTKDLQQQMATMSPQSMRQKTPEACLQRAKIRGSVAEVNAAIDREYDYITQQIQQTQPHH